MAAVDNTARQVPTQKLSDFQQCILHILRERPKYGLAIKEELGAYYQEEINHGRLYPNLDDLVDQGLVEKADRDGRTNDYRLTEAGEQWIETRRAWEESWDEAGDE
jgi:DNA-binding PadR family transcriptional regulator